MSRKPLLFTWSTIVALGMLVGACGGAVTVETTGTTYDDPFANCAAVGTFDRPDSRYTGPDIIDDVIDGYLQAAGLQGTIEPSEVLEQTTVWRCMDHDVYGCNVGRQPSLRLQGRPRARLHLPR